MSQVVPKWLDTQTWIALAVVPALGGAVLGASQEGLALALAIGVLFALVFIIGLSLDPFVALLVGLGGGGAFILAKESAGQWLPGSFVENVGMVLLMILTGFAAGLLGRHLRLRRLYEDQQRPAQPLDQETLGPFAFLNADFGKARLDEEMERAGLFRRPLSLLHVAFAPRVDGLALQAQESLRNTIARVVEGLLRVTDVPFTYHPPGHDTSVIAVILPETQRSEAELLASLIHDGLQRATFSDPSADRRQMVGAFADVTLQTAAYPDDGVQAEALLSAARESEAQPHAPAIARRATQAANATDEANTTRISPPRPRV